MINKKIKVENLNLPKLWPYYFCKESVERRLKELKIIFANKSSNEWSGRLPVVKESRQSTSTL